MDEMEAQPDWNVDGSDGEYDSDLSVSESEGSEGEVPVVTDYSKELPPSGHLSAGVGKGNLKTSVWKTKSPTAVASNQLDGAPCARAWKPVIDGKLQVVGETATLKVRGASNLPGSTATSAQKQLISANASASPGVTGLTEFKKDGNESDADVRRVPEMSSKGGSAVASAAQLLVHSSSSRPRKRGGGSADKEHKRLKRLLRNRVSAQQARERKKAYLTDLEVRAKELQQRNDELEERLSIVQRENNMLRQIVRNTTGKKPGGGSEI